MITGVSFIALLVTTLSLSYHLSTHYPCGYHTKKTRGYISTPNFPKPYPVPIICQWVIEAPSDFKIAVYFTQFYLKTGFSASEYAHYTADVREGVSKSDFGMISSKDEPTYLMSNQRILVLDLHVYSLDNVHLRVTEHLLEIYGFNITYEVLQTNETVRQDGCIYHHCSFTGFCLASEDLENYNCECVTGYFGEECQYDENCGPTATTKVCYNGGTCRYYIGSSVRTCECSPGFEGAKCERHSQSENGSVSDPSLLTVKSDYKCERMHYTSHPDYIAIYPGDRKCPPKGKNMLVIKAEINVTVFNTVISEATDLRNALENAVYEQLHSVLLQDINVTSFFINGSSIHIEFPEEEGIVDWRETLHKNLTYIKNNFLAVDFRNMELQVKSIIFIQRMEISEKLPIVEGSPFILACVVHGGPETKVKWQKDNSPIVFPKRHGRLWNSTIPRNSYDSLTFLLGFDKSHVLDSGTFTCEATDETGTDKFTVSVIVKKLAKPLLTPLSATFRVNDSLTITCVSEEVHRNKNVAYLWSRNGGSLLRNREQVEDLFPSGSRVIVNRATESANYTCVIHSVYGIKKETSIITVISDNDFSTSTCNRETLFGINWKLTAVGSEDFHLCPYNYTGYIFRKCLKAENQSTTWDEPDFSRCLSAPFLKIKNGFESYKLGYRIHTLNILLKKMLNTLNEMASSSLHLSEAEPLISILTDLDSSLYLKDDAEQNWKTILNITAMLLNSTAVSRKQSKQKMHFLIRNISHSYGKEYLTNNSSQSFESQTLMAPNGSAQKHTHKVILDIKALDSQLEVVKVWKIQEDLPKFSIFPHLNPWNNSIDIHLEINMCNSSDFEGNSSVNVIMLVYRSYVIAGIDRFLNSYAIPSSENETLPVINTEAKSEACENGIQIKVFLTYKYSERSKRKAQALSCFKISETERYQKIQPCEAVERSTEAMVCQCFSSGLLSLVLLEKESEKTKDDSFSMKYKILPIVGAVISITFLFYALSMLLYKEKFSTLFE